MIEKLKSISKCAHMYTTGHNPKNKNRETTKPLIIEGISDMPLGNFNYASQIPAAISLLLSSSSTTL
jgi:hypothetical protein